ncbi:MAG: DNA-3-methyladenine glycosylase [Candidatus Kryptoniota bacterium]
MKIGAPSYRPLPLEFYQKQTLELVPDILGKLLVRTFRGKFLAGRIVEIEAYVGNDPASHAARGMTERNKVMFEEGGIAYVYFTYGMHFCFNIVTDRKGFPAAFLVRAVEPVAGIDEMRKNRGVSSKGGRVSNTDLLYGLTNGPAKLCQAMRIDRKLNGEKLDSGKLFLADDGFVLYANEIGNSTRIGISVGREAKWRFFLKGNEFVSKVKDQNSKVRDKVRKKDNVKAPHGKPE